MSYEVASGQVIRQTFRSHMVKGSSLCAFRAALCNFIGTQARVSGRLPGLRTRPSPAIRFCRGNDVAEWLHLMEHHNISVDSYPLRGGVRDNANYHFTDRNGGRDIDFRRFAVEGTRLHGSLANIREGIVAFRADLATNLDDADRTNESILVPLSREKASRHRQRLPIIRSGTRVPMMRLRSHRVRPTSPV
jgi:hypothetical protein